jgi:Flp pilus assembly protein TadD
VTFLSHGDLQGATGHFREALITDPDNAQAHNNLGVTLEEQSDIEGAIREYREALRLQPRYEEARRNLDIALRKR